MTTTVDPRPFKIWVVWGEDRTVADLLSDDVRRDHGKITDATIARRVSAYDFATAAELDAFLLGVGESDGWLEASTHETRAEAVDALRQIARDYVDGYEDEDADD